MSQLNTISTTNALYNRLSERREIRLLELLPGTAEVCCQTSGRARTFDVELTVLQEAVECLIHHAVLENREWPRYEAVSYTWEDSHTTTIVCNGLSFVATQNLHNALVQLRPISTSRWLWVDQICINQNDKNEKDNVQVPLMTDIYSNAWRVLVWLGPTMNDSDLAMDCFTQLVQDLLEVTAEGDKRIEQVSQWHHKEARALNSLLNRKWFTRVWTLQEVAVARRATVVCGGKELEWRLLQQFNDACQNDNDGRWTSLLQKIVSSTDLRTGEFRRYEIANINAISRLAKRFRSEEPRNSETNDALHLHRVRSCGVTYPIDKVLALLRFLSPRLQACCRSLDHGIGHTTEQFYTAVARFELVDCHNMDFLGAAGLVQRSHKHRSMPTWVPDWDVPEITHDLWFLNKLALEHSDDHLYRASHAQSESLDVTAKGNFLSLRARIIDDVQAVGNPSQFSIKNDIVKSRDGASANPMQLVSSMGQQRTKHINECLSLAERCKPHYEAAFATACRQTLMRGIMRHGDGVAIGGTQRRASDEELELLFDTYTRLMQMIGMPTSIDLPRSELAARPTDWQLITEPPRALTLVEHIQDSFKGRVFFTTKTGYMGLGPCGIERTKVDDKICVVQGCSTPFVIRPVTDSKCYELVGEAYVHGLMDGEAATMNGIAEEVLTLR